MISKLRMSRLTRGAMSLELALVIGLPLMSIVVGVGLVVVAALHGFHETGAVPHFHH